MQEMAHIANGRDTGNCVSLLRVNVRFNSIILFLFVLVGSIISNIFHDQYPVISINE